MPVLIILPNLSGSKSFNSKMFIFLLCTISLKSYRLNAKEAVLRIFRTL